MKENAHFSFTTRRHFFSLSLSLSLSLFVGPQAVQELWAIMVDKLLEAISLEPDADIVSIMMDSLCKVHLSVCVCVCDTVCVCVVTCTCTCVCGGCGGA